MTKSINELLEELGTPDYPKPEAPPWHVDDIYHCAYGWTDGTTWGVCDCENPAEPWPAREPGDGPRDCSCFVCMDHEPRWERGKLEHCEYRKHHCDMCHGLRQCTIPECGFVSISDKKPETVKEFIERAKAAGHDSLGIANDPEAVEILSRLRRKRKCARPNCRRHVKYTSPKDLCSKHWKMWWKYGIKGKKELWWMR